jgi:hypothetical protein
LGEASVLAGHLWAIRRNEVLGVAHARRLLAEESMTMTSRLSRDRWGTGAGSCRRRFGVAVATVVAAALVRPHLINS